MSKPRLQDVAETIQVYVAGLLNAAGITQKGQVVVGWPATPDLTQILGQAGEQWQVSVWPCDDTKNTSRYEATSFKLASPNVPMTATVAGDILTFGGSVIAGLNVHTFVGRFLQDAFYQTTSLDTLGSVAVGVQNAINALSVSGVAAAASGDSTTITGSPLLRCNVGGAGLVSAKEVGRVSRSVQVSVWAPDPVIRWALADPIITGAGEADSTYLTLSDGTPMFVLYECDSMRDKAQSSYSLYEHHMRFHVEYGIIKYLQGTQVESVEITETLNGGTPVTFVGG